MKTNRPTHPSSSDKEKKGEGKVTIRVPLSWEALTDHQRTYLCTVLAGGGWQSDEVKALLLLRLSGLRPDRARWAKDQIAQHLDLLGWIDSPPESPSRLTAIDGHPALEAMLYGVPFRTYLAIENYYQAYITTREPQAIDALARELYPGLNRQPTPAEQYMIILWIIGLKTTYARLFPHLFSSTATDPDSAPDPRQIMNAEIRALNGGDITKLEAVFSSANIDAMTEIDAKAHEAKEMEKAMKG